MSDVLALKMPLPGEASTVEGRLADIIDSPMEPCDIWLPSKDGPVQDGYRLSDEDRALVVAALRIVHTAKMELKNEH